MNSQALVRLRRAIRSRFLPRRHTALLVAIVTAFMVRPLIGDGQVATASLSGALLVLLLVALYTTQVDELVGEREVLVVQRRRRSVLGWMLAGPAMIERLVAIFAPSPGLLKVGSISWLLFFCFVTWSQLHNVLKQKEITRETFSMSISVYLLFGLTWGVLYIVIFQFQPYAFSLGASADIPPGPHGQQHLFPIFMYFSLTTLATIGYGDITPLSLQARYAAIAEGITGQLYLAILIARLVGLHIVRLIGERAEKESHRE